VGFLRLKVLGAFGGKGKRKKSTSFLLEEFVIDAGNLFPLVNGSYNISNLFLTHSHFDHIADLPFFLDFAFLTREEGLKVFASGKTIDALRKYIFNGAIWPDFSSFYAPKGKPFIEFALVREFQSVKLGKFTVTPLPSVHTVETYGFKVEKEGRSIVLSGDTKSNPLLWEVVNADVSVRAVLIDVSFPSRLQEVADASGHFTPNSLISDLKKLKRDVDLYVYHIKPPFYEEVVKELREKLPFVRVLEDNMLIEV